MIDVSAEQLNVILNILKQHVPGYEVRAFGSRHNWTAKDYSDLDLAVVGETKLDWKIISNLKEAFEESNLPFRVDVLDWHAISPKFRNVVAAGFEVIQKRLPVRGRTQTEGLDMRDKGWKKYRLGELIGINEQSITSNFPFKDIEYIDTSSVTSNKYDPLQKLKLSEAPSRAKRIVRHGDTIISTVRPIQRHFGFIKEPNKNTIASTGFAVLTPKKIYPEFLYYYISQDSVTLYLNGIAETTTTTFPAFRPDTLAELNVEIPDSIETQRRIASILSALDDKIELNRQTNATLEAIAQAIFKEWFVDFRFPHSPLEGWQAKPDGVDSSPLEGCPKGGVDVSPSCPTSGTDSLQAKPAPLASWQKNSLFPFWALPKNHKLQERAKELRKQGILSEVLFWKAFKDKKKLGWDIDRQVIIGSFIVDFFIPELGLVFEIDGSSHNDKQEYDQERDVFLSSLQLKVVRISDKDVLRNIEGVWSFVTESIKDRVEELSPPRPSGTPQEGKNPPRQALPATPQEGNKCEMQDSELGPIPKGWRVGKLGEVCEFAYGKGLKSESRIDGKYPVVGSNGIVGTHAEYFVDGPGIVIGRKGTIGEVLWIHQDFFPIDTTFYIKDLLGVNGLYFHYFLLKLQDFKKISSDSAVPGLNRNQAYDNTVNIPTKNSINEFNKIVRDMFENIQNNEQQSAAIAAIRDALLPKLMNGEIEV